MLGFLGRHATAFLAGGVFLGLALQGLAAILKPLLMPSIAALLFLSVLRLDWALIAGYARRPLVAALASLWQLVASPLLVWGLAGLIGLPPVLATALILNAAASPVMSSPAFARLLGLNAELVVVVLAATTIVLPLTLAPVALWLLRQGTVIDPADYAARTALYLVLPLAAAAAFRALAGSDRIAARDAGIQGLIVIVLLVFAVAVMDGVTARLAGEWRLVLLFLAAATAHNLGFQLATVWIFRPAGRRSAMSLGLAAGYRNMALVVAVTGGTAPDLLLYLAIAQVPIYVLPFLTRPLIRRIDA